MKAYPFLIQQDASGEALRPVAGRESTYNEAWLQELLRQHSDILPVAEIEPVFYPLISIGREVITETGVIDNLFISPRGYLVLVETKLWRNPQAKREVVAQAIDYASSLSKWNYGRLNHAVREYLAKYENVDRDLVDWVEDQLGPVEGGRHFFEDTVTKNLRLGRFLTLIVGDRIRQSLIEMLNYVNKYPHLATDVALVELQCYRWRQESDWPLLVIPSIVARTEIVERSVIQVTVEGATEYRVGVRQEKAEEEERRRKQVTLTEEAFWELLRERVPESYDDARRLIEHFRDTEGVVIDPMTSSVVVRLNTQGMGETISLFFVNDSGYANVWPQTIQAQLNRVGLDPKLIESYDAQMRNIMNMGKSRKELSSLIVDLDVERFSAIVDGFIQEIQRAEPTDE